MLALNGTALTLWGLFYFPPSFEQKHKNDIQSKMYWLKNFDFVGAFLYTAGVIVFLFGINWGGSVYPWKSAAVIASMVGGGVVFVAFVLYEAFIPLKEPIMSVHIWRNGKWSAATVLFGIGAGVYYAFAIVWAVTSLRPVRQS